MIGRRSLLKSAILAPLSGPGTPASDHAILSLAPRITEVIASLGPAYSAFSAAEMALFARNPHGQAPSAAIYAPGTGGACAATGRCGCDWPQEHARPSRELGIDDAEARLGRLEAQFAALVASIEQTRAVTLEGLVFKARLVRRWEDMSESIVKDLLAIGETMPPGDVPWIGP